MFMGTLFSWAHYVHGHLMLLEYGEHCIQMKKEVIEDMHSAHISSFFFFSCASSIAALYFTYKANIKVYLSRISGWQQQNIKSSMGFIGHRALLTTVLHETAQVTAL